MSKILHVLSKKLYIQIRRLQYTIVFCVPTLVLEEKTNSKYKFTITYEPLIYSDKY